MTGKSKIIIRVAENPLGCLNRYTDEDWSVGRNYKEKGRSVVQCVLSPFVVNRFHCNFIKRIFCSFKNK